MKTHLYLLELIDDRGVFWDTQRMVVVRASDAKRARQLASESHGDEGPEAWLDTNRVKCTQLHFVGKEQVICRDYAAG